MTATFNLDNTIVLSKLVVENFGADHVDRGTTQIAARPMHGYRDADGGPSCFVGAVLDVVGLLHRLPRAPKNVEEPWYGGVNYVGFQSLCLYDSVIGNSFTPDAQRFLLVAQSRQDHFMSWGEVVAYAERYMRERLARHDETSTSHPGGGLVTMSEWWQSAVAVNSSGPVYFDSFGKDGKPVWKDAGYISTDGPLKVSYGVSDVQFQQVYDPATMTYKVLMGNTTVWSTTPEQALNAFMVGPAPNTLSSPLAKLAAHDAKKEAETELYAALTEALATVDSATTDEKIDNTELVTV